MSLFERPNFEKRKNALYSLLLLVPSGVLSLPLLVPAAEFSLILLVATVYSSLSMQGLRLMLLVITGRTKTRAAI